MWRAYFISGLLIGSTLESFSYRYPIFATRSLRLKSGTDSFDGAEFEKFLKTVQPLTSSVQPDATTINELREIQTGNNEEIFRKYPFVDTELPVLPDCDNYYS